VFRSCGYDDGGAQDSEESCVCVCVCVCLRVCVRDEMRISEALYHHITSLKCDSVKTRLHLHRCRRGAILLGLGNVGMWRSNGRTGIRGGRAGLGQQFTAANRQKHHGVDKLLDLSLHLHLSISLFTTLTRNWQLIVYPSSSVESVSQHHVRTGRKRRGKSVGVCVRCAPPNAPCS